MNRLLIESKVQVQISRRLDGSEVLVILLVEHGRGLRLLEASHKQVNKWQEIAINCGAAAAC
jgi:hypothetical protein